MSNFKLVPMLRFSGFTDEWQIRRVSELGSVVTGSTPSTSDQSLYGDEYNFICPGDMNTGRYVFQTKQKLSYKGFSRSRAIPAGSTLFVCIGSTIGKTAQTTVQSMTNQQINSVIPNEKYDIDFVYLALSRLSNRIASLAGKQAVPILSKGDFQKNIVAAPPKPEQEKIADFLTAVDKRIELQEKRVELLKKYKKGVMQKIFSQKIRFKDANSNDYPEWQNKTLAEIGKTYNGLQGKNSADFGDGKFYITYKQTFDSSRIDVSKFERVRIALGEKQNAVQFGDLFFTTSSETPEEVGFASVLLDKVKNVYLNSFCFGFRPNSLQELNPAFAQYLFRSYPFRELMRKLAQGSTRYNLSKHDFLKIVIKLPALEEQQKITNFLSSLDDKIDLENKKLEQAKLFKKSLIQRMFV